MYVFCELRFVKEETRERTGAAISSYILVLQFYSFLLGLNASLVAGELTDYLPMITVMLRKPAAPARVRRSRHHIP